MGFSLTRIGFVVIRPMAFVILFLVALGLVGYLVPIETLYRPLAGGPATHPMTLMMAGLVALSIQGQRQHRASPVWDLFAAVAAFSCLLRLMQPEHLSSISPFGLPMPFADTVAADLAAGRSNAMGGNTAMMFLLTAVAVLSRRRIGPLFSQLTAFLAMAFPMVAVTGYGYGLSGFHGQMSLSTIVLGAPLAICAALLSSHRSMLRTLLGASLGGRMARVQIILGYAFPWVVGFLMLRALNHGGDWNLYGIFVVTISWFMIFLVGISAVLHERSDHARRLMERALVKGATFDGLTQARNRRSFTEEVHLQWRRVDRTGHPFALVLLDLDHFKAVNDTGGHAKGDLVLRAVAATLKAKVRSTDIVGRLGGEEFAVLMPDATHRGAARVAEELRAAVAALDFEPWPGHDGRITLSVGHALSSDHDSIDGLYQSADAALYRAKELGRNRVMAAKPSRVTEEDGTEVSDISTLRAGAQA